MTADVLTVETADLRALFGLIPEHERERADAAEQKPKIAVPHVRRPIDWTLQQRQFFQNTML